MLPYKILPLSILHYLIYNYINLREQFKQQIYKLKNCTFIESALFTLSKIESIISLKYFILDQSILRNSSIFSFFISYSEKQKYLNLFNTIIENNNFSYSYLINCTNQIKIKLHNFQFKLYRSPGFWRPNNFCDLVEPCFKNPLFCNGRQAIQEPYAKNVIYIILGVMEIILKTNGVIYYHFQQPVFGRQYRYQCHQEVSLGLTHYINHQQLLQNLVKYYLNQIKFNNIKQILDQESIQLKMLINYIWIFSVIFTFNIRTSYFIVTDFDCQISSIEQIPIVYLKILTMLIIIIILFIFTTSGSILIHYPKCNSYWILLVWKSMMKIYQLQLYYTSLLILHNQKHICIVHSWIVLIGGFIPILIFILLIVNKSRFDKIKIRKHIHYLLNECEYQKYYWELIKLFKKTIIIVIMTNFETDIVLKASLIGLCLLVYQILAPFHQPFIIQKYNTLDLYSSQICSILIFLAKIKYISEQNINEFLSIILQIFIISYEKKYKFFFLNQFHFLLKQKVEKQKLREQKLKKNIIILKNHLIYFSKLNSKQIMTGYYLSSYSSRIQSVKSGRLGIKKLYFDLIEQDEFTKN
ncbi:unnamed protein product [Paramecium sonneborni]|uniref:Transmembrane protein n=1 Tax=Paramecium sonneborni TaxID=65129 RepID=A0A8S1RJ38_9CILI|nr:unnamed protein product [Paramecium sonneborni]